MAYLTKITEEYRVNSENEVTELIENAKKDNRFNVIKQSTVYKTIKEKKEIVDEYWICTLVKQFTDPKEPDCMVTVDYTIDNGFFPSPVNESEDEE